MTSDVSELQAQLEALRNAARTGGGGADEEGDEEDERCEELHAMHAHSRWRLIGLL
jgi:hypothetical protein